MIRVRDYDMSRLRASALRRLVADGEPWSENEIAYMAEELNLSILETKEMLETL